MVRQSQYWCFTYNNYDDAVIERIESLYDGESVQYLVVGREVGEQGTPHLQGFIIFATRKRFGTVRNLIVGSHIEAANGTPFQAAQYCKKDGRFSEFGTPPVDRPSRTGSRGLFAEFVGYISEFYSTANRSPSEREIANAFPALYVRYRGALLDLVEHLLPTPEIEIGELREWQQDLNSWITGEPDDRVIIFVVDPQGGSGKSFFQRWFFSQHGETTQLLSIGKRDDIAHVIDPFKNVFLFNIPRGGMEHLQYTILEQLKDRVVFSPKYNSRTKILREKCHVVVFSNEAPDETKMSADRFHIINL